MSVDLRRMSDTDRLAAMGPYEQRRVAVRTSEPRELRGFLVAVAEQRWSHGSPILIVALDAGDENGGGDVALPSAQVVRLALASERDR